MASEAKFKTIPAFPDDLPTLEMQSMSLSKLLSSDKKTSDDLLSGCQDLGFFLLDLRGNALGEAMIEEVDQLFDFGKEALTLPSEVKLQYPIRPGKGMVGFKIPAYTKTETGQQDRYEMLNVSQDGLTGNKELEPLPEFVTNKLDLLKSYTVHSQTVIAAICRALALQLSLPEDAFTSLHDPTKLSGTTIRVVRSYACPEVEEQRTSMIHHTDFGSITLLANLIGGLQVLLPGKDPLDDSAWRWVRPQSGHLIVNLGDVMVEWSAGALRSNVHRIRHQPGEQKYLDRYSVAVLARPQMDASMKRMIGPPSDDDIDMTALQYEQYKFKLITEGKWVMESHGGKHGKLGKLVEQAAN